MTEGKNTVGESQNALNAFLEWTEVNGQGHPASIFGNIRSEDDLKSRIFETFVVKFLACLPLLGFSNIDKMA